MGETNLIFVKKVLGYFRDISPSFNEGKVLSLDEKKNLALSSEFANFSKEEREILFSIAKLSDKDRIIFEENYRKKVNRLEGN